MQIRTVTYIVENVRTFFYIFIKTEFQKYRLQREILRFKDIVLSRARYNCGEASTSKVNSDNLFYLKFSRFDYSIIPISPAVSENWNILQICTSGNSHAPHRSELRAVVAKRIKCNYASRCTVRPTREDERTECSARVEKISAAFKSMLSLPPSPPCYTAHHGLTPPSCASQKP